MINNEYRYKNTHSSIYFARDYLKNTYICCADNYYTKNVFHKYEYHALYSTLYMPGIWRGERGVFCDKDGLIINTRRPAVDQWVMNGYAYFDREFSRICDIFHKLGEQLYLIDWEYAGDADKGVDLCKLFVKNKATGADIDRYLSFYFGRKPDCEECRHIIGCAAVSFYYWYVWALFMVKKGNDYADLAFNYLTITDRYINEYDDRKGAK